MIAIFDDSNDKKIVNIQNKLLDENGTVNYDRQQAFSEEKFIDILRKINATIKFVSFEPLIGSVGKIDLTNIDWAIVGGESGNRARLIKHEWVNEIYLQCKKQNVPFFFKQWGTWGADGIKRNKKANGKLFKNKEWHEYPVVRI